MEDIIGKKAVLDDGPSEDDLIDRDLGTPEFVSYSALREARQLHGVIRTRFPSDTTLNHKVEQAVLLLRQIDETIHEGLAT